MRLPILAVVLSFGLASCGPADDAGGEEGGSRTTTPAASSADTATPAPEPSLRVVFLGTSLTAGLGLQRTDDRYTARLQALADSAGIPARMVNAGVSGETSAGGLRRTDWILRDPLDVLVVELGANDGLRGQDPAAMESNLRQVVERTRARYPDASVVLLGMEAPPNMGDAYTGRFRRAFRRVADDTGAAFVPFLLEGVAGAPELNQADGIHPTAEGHRRMARTVWPVLEEVLRRELREGEREGGVGPDGSTDTDGDAG